ncbi:MAG: M48 family metalloprotease, partial [Actinomycetota bacterium]|nr:M48 family metalloprotease [Actinomycetota bacterium]
VIAAVSGARALARAPFVVLGAVRRREGVARVAAEEARTLLATVVAGVALTVPLYALLRTTAAWWVLAWALFAMVTLAAQGVFPFMLRVVVGPVAPADRALSAQVGAVAGRAGVDVRRGVLVAGKPGSTRCNAYVVGLGRSRRVVLDRALAAWPAPMVDQVVAHEIGHWRLRHNLVRLPLTLAVELVTLGIAARLVAWAPLLHRAGVASAGDPASYPLLLLLTPLLVLPARIVLSWRDRAQEREADRFALALLGQPGHFSDMLDRAAGEAGAPRALPWWSRVIASHPPIDERAAACALAVGATA